MRKPLPFRQVTLAPAQRLFRPLALGGIHHRPDKLESARLVSLGTSHNMDMFDGTIRHQQPMLKIKILPILRRAFDRLFHLSRVFGMNALEDIFHGWCHGSVVLEDSKRFLRPGDLAGRNSPAKTSGVTEPLS